MRNKGMRMGLKEDKEEEEGEEVVIDMVAVK